VSNKFDSKVADEKGVGLVFRELCWWEVGVLLGWLLMSQGHLDRITWSLRGMKPELKERNPQKSCTGTFRNRRGTSNRGSPRRIAVCVFEDTEGAVLCTASSSH
jgi:hypothetical protein